ncbi:LaeA-like protein, partial [Apiospora kogelbergensis]|uniref:LaeA-like protein n=1 Tax=Apiospora kogelbergensis TaxID=1337665 RepID=UPI00312F2BB9
LSATMASSVNIDPGILALSTSHYDQNDRCYGEYCRSEYLLPVDDIEQDRLDITHKFITVAREDSGSDQGNKRSQNGLHARPLPCNGPPRILDLGCGTGIWCNDMAEKYPNANVIGCDLNMMMVPASILPNTYFFPLDIRDPTWGLDPNSMDLIHMRLLGGCITDWRAVYQNAFNHLKPGTGLFEHIEIDYRHFSHNSTLPENSNVHYWMKEVYGAFERAGKPLFPHDDPTTVLKQLGFVNIVHEDQEIPYHPWPEDEHLKEIARWFNLSMQSAIPAMSLEA